MGATVMLVTILGPGCANCAALERVTRAALAALGVDATVRHITDYATIAAYGVMSTPALAVGEKVVLAGRVPSVGQLTALLSVHIGHDAGGSTGTGART
jgi:small redox-active disulfide protein 2